MLKNIALRCIYGKIRKCSEDIWLPKDEIVPMSIEDRIKLVICCNYIRHQIPFFSFLTQIVYAMPMVFIRKGFLLVIKKKLKKFILMCYTFRKVAFM